MAKDTEELTVMLGGAVYVADVGEPRPTDPEIIAGTWEDLGHITTDGIVFEVEREVTDINSVWEQDPIRRLVTRVPKVMRFQLQQLSVHTLPFALGGGTVDEPTAGIFEYSPPDPSDLDERAMLWQIIDGDKAYLFNYYRGNVTGTSSITGVRDNVALLPVEYSILTPTLGGDPFNMITNDPAFEPIAS